MLSLVECYSEVWPVQCRELCDLLWSRYPGCRGEIVTVETADINPVIRVSEADQAVEILLSGNASSMMFSGNVLEVIYRECQNAVPEEWLSAWGGADPMLLFRKTKYRGVLVRDGDQWRGMQRDAVVVRPAFAMSLMGHFMPAWECLDGDCEFAKRLCEIPFARLVREVMGGPGKLLVCIE